MYLQLETYSRKLLKETIKVNDFEFEQTFNKVGHKKILLNARKIYRSDMGKDTIILAMTIKY